MINMLPLELQIVARSRRYAGEALTNLHSYIDKSLLSESFEQLNKKGAQGIDGESWQDYDNQREERIEQLYVAFKSGRYRAPSVRRVYIPKSKGKQRPIGIPTVEDKILQKAITRILTPIYEDMFYDFSYGFRPYRSQYQALDELFKVVSFRKQYYLIDADMRNYFGSMNHKCLREMLDLRIKDGVIRRQIDKWLKAGVLENGQLTYPKEGTPQGGTISPLLSNIYLHYVLDEWFTEQIQPLLKGESSIIRFADDFLLCFERKEDAERVYKVLPKRLAKYGLSLNEEKTQIVDVTPRDKRQAKRGTFSFLGFTHYMSKSRKGYPVLKRKTSSKKFSRSLSELNVWFRKNRHKPLKELMKTLSSKLRGHYNYYGVTFNSRKIHSYYNQVKRLLHKWLNRRGGKRKWNWGKVKFLTEEWQPLPKPKIYHGYRLTKP